MKRWTMLLFLIFTGIVPAQVAPRPLQGSSCQRFAQDFYDWYVPFTQKQLHMPASNVPLQRRPTLFSPELLHALRIDSEAQARAKGELVGLDFDPFLGSQDPADHYDARHATAKDRTCSVEVWRASPTDTAAKLNKPEAVAQLEQHNGRWQFVNFSYPIGGPDLLRLLANLREERSVTVSVNELVDGGSKYTGRLLQVWGCYDKNFEVSVLQPCDAVSWVKYRLWVDDVDDFVAELNYTHERFIPSDQPATRKKRHLWEMTTNNKTLPVVVVGEYQTRDGGGYGHLGAYPHRFIVHRVIGEISTTSAAPDDPSLFGVGGLSFRSFIRWLIANWR